MLLILLLCLFVNDSLSNSTDLRVYKGIGVGIHEYSFAVFLHFKNTKPSSCGASLIMVQAVITAAHCVEELRYNKGTISAFFGATVPNDSEVVRTAIDYIIHPKYNEKKGKCNMAVVFLDSRVPLRHEIKKVPLAVTDPGTDVKTVVVAWGKQNYGKLPDFSQLRSLKATKQKIIPYRECPKMVGEKFSPKMMCTIPLVGHFARDDCGSGLVLIKPSHILVGVLSYIEDDIGYYTSVYTERNWIIQSCYDLYKRNCPNGKIKRKSSVLDGANFV